MAFVELKIRNCFINIDELIGIPEIMNSLLVMFNLTGLNYFRHFPSNLP